MLASRAAFTLLLAGLLLIPPSGAARTPKITAADQEFRTALSYYQAGEYPKAAEELEDLARRIPPNFQVQELLGLVYSAEKNDRAAYRALAAAVRLNPGSAAAHANLAVNLDRLGMTKQAAAEFKRALQVAPEEYDPNHDLGELYVKAGKLTEAIPYLRQAQRLQPDSYGNGYDLALAYEKTGDLNEARQEISRLLQVKQTAELFGLLGEIDERSGKYIDAANEYRRAVRLDPSEQNIFDWGSEFLLHHTWSPAIAIFSDGLKRYPNSAALSVGLGLALNWHGDYKRAVQILVRATDLAPTDPHTYYFLSQAYQRAPGEMAEVIARFSRYEKLRPRDSQAAYLYAMSLWKGKEEATSSPDLAQVGSLLRKAVELDPSSANARLQLGNLYSQERQYAQAVPEYQRSLQLDSDLTDAYYRLGQAYVHLGKAELARREFALHQEAYNRHLAASDRERAQIRKFVTSVRSQVSPTSR